ncbi:hypothetical protein E2C01_078639 [Portunus trituberculatus]|uniref:Uncharacterized protein n=1 Tax=Portunus trituberculatus TaxID=210409 RepID=A0A5B7IQR7_PORTR|nr:hypothetical protein [Portunus trituberculatus]
MAVELLPRLLQEPLGWERLLVAGGVSPPSGERFMVYWCVLVLFAQLHVISVLVYALATDT